MSDHLRWAMELPETWQAKPTRSVANYMVSNVDKISLDNEIVVRLCNYTDVYKNDFITPDMPFMSGTATKEEIEKFGLRVDDVLITKDSESWQDIGIPAVVIGTSADLVCGYHLAMLRPNANVLSGRYLFRCLQSKPIRTQLELAANGVTRFGIPKSAIGALLLPVPPLPQQHAIAAFLDRETARIDELIAEKENLIALIAEKRRALVAHAVTRGLDPNVPMRDSGIPWLGEIPAHWGVERIAFQFRERDQRGEPDLPLLEVSINSGVILREFSRDKIEGTASDFNTYKVARKDDIVFNKMRMWQGAVGLTPQDGLVSPDYVVAEPIGSLLPSYAAQLFRTPMFSAEAGRNSHGIVWDRLRLYWEGFRDILVPLPKPEEQRAIVEYVKAGTARLDLLRKSAQQTFELLKERRSALIAAAVTGEISTENLE